MPTGGGVIAGEEAEVTTTQERPAERLDRFEHLVELPLLVLALLMVPLLVAPVAFDLSARVEQAVLTLDWIIWGVFAAELAIRTYLAPRRLAYLWQHWFDVLIVALPFLRPLRIVRSARALRLLRGVRLLAYLFRATHTTRAIMARQSVQGSLLFALGALTASAIAITFAEQGSGGSIDGFDTAVWWAFATVTTVGYGDTFPVTVVGRGVATLLMLVGIGLFGVITANVAAYFVESAQDEPRRTDARSLDEVLAELRRLHDRLDAAEIARAGAATRDG